mmetsp:Transcript_15095/g.28403  ORF Transcript_15095/g.28403 Transcript_15095/m.28403 type:complete len:283 (-) Transcript_15095:108-956(-)|eukprot:CAMPEP_0176494386 /NCGR_PEP_ID=MMETSP0200_2-20121128/10065_1 /TAXON_ID=947934 /ORGANISM="Chaetoceros sp., Strain GSL56" /LENGTH=282 /DNA_ID=CAMNT_0017892133 /DNA_START=79 /DNA_END=927 /DNA_ORIENTATION=-
MMIRHLRASRLSIFAITLILVHCMVDAAGGGASSSLLAFVPNMIPNYKISSRTTAIIPNKFHNRLPGIPIATKSIQLSDDGNHLRKTNPQEDKDDVMIAVRQAKRSLRDTIQSWLNNLVKQSPSSWPPVSFDKPPPMKIDDFPLLFYDIFLILNLSVSISFWVVHRLSFLDILPALSEGSLLCILWIIAGLWNGAFLYSAVDGHYDPQQQGKGGPTYAALLGLSTFVTTANMRVMIALITAMIEHRRVGVNHGEDLIPLEIACGLVLMASWRMLHSSYTPRG